MGSPHRSWRGREMPSGLLLGLVPNASNAESAINDFVEAGVSERRISIVMSDESVARAIAPDTGALRGANSSDVLTRLTGLGMTPDAAKVYADGLLGGQVLIAVEVEGEW